MFTDDIPWDIQTGFSEAPIKDSFYVFSVDMAASEDETSCTCLRYNIKSLTQNKTLISLPHKVAYHRFWKGKSLPLSLQYEIIKQDYLVFKKVSPMRTRFVYDAGSLGGKNAGQAFSVLNGLPFPPKGRSYVDVKAEGMGKVKEVLSKNRDFIINEKGERVDKNPDWGGVRASSKLIELRRQMEIASKDDDKLKNDQYTSFMQAIHFAEVRTPRPGVHNKAVDFNYNRGTLGRG